MSWCWLRQLMEYIKAERDFIKKDYKKAVKVYSFFYDGDVKTAKEVMKGLVVSDYEKHYKKVIEA